MNALNPGLSPALQRLGEVSVRLSVELGRADMPLRDVLALGEGSVVSLDRLTDELLEITANGQVIAYGEVIAQDGRFALRIVSLAGGDAPMPGRPSKPAARSQSSAGAVASGPKRDPSAPGHAPLPENAAEDVAFSSSGDADVDELAAVLDDTLDGPIGDDAQSDPLADALADLPETSQGTDAQDGAAQ